MASKIVVGMSIAGATATFLISQVQQDTFQWSFNFGKSTQSRRPSIYSEIIDRDRQLLRGQQPRTINPLIKDLWAQMGSTPASAGAPSDETTRQWRNRQF